MRRELDEALVEKYPKIFRDRHGDMRTTAMCWGFECDDGWYDLIDELCSELYKEDQIPVAMQVKEKYGTLRFYLGAASDRAWKLVDQAELKSEKTCEVCGDEGSIATTSGN